jgi:TolB protein
MRLFVRLPVYSALLLACAVASSETRAQTAAPTMVGVQDVSWSADGSKLFFSAMRVKPDYSDYSPDKWAVYRYDLRARTLTRVAAAAFSVAASPREPIIVVGRWVNGNRDLYVLNEDGRVLGRVTTDTAEDFGPDWSPDGRQIAFTSKRDGQTQIYIANRDGSGQRRLTHATTHRSHNPSWSRDGQYIAYYAEKGDGKDQVHVLRADGTADRNLTSDEFNNIYPAFTPDGRIVYGQGLKGAPTRAFTVTMDGREKRPLLGINSFYTRYSPDGSMIACLEDGPGSEGVRLTIARSDGQSVTQVPLTEVR